MNYVEKYEMYVGLVIGIIHYGACYRHNIENKNQTWLHRIEHDIPANKITKLFKGKDSRRSVKVLSGSMINLRNRLIHEKYDFILLKEAIMRQDISVSSAVQFTKAVIEESNAVDIYDMENVIVAWTYIF